MEIGYLSEKLRIDTSISSVLQLTEENKNIRNYSGLKLAIKVSA